jgi:hypothetical protein
MDAGTFVLLDKIREKEPITWEDIQLLFVILPLFSILISQFPNILKTFYSKLNVDWGSLLKGRHFQMEFMGTESFVEGAFVFEYPETMLAINHWLVVNKKINNFRLINLNRNGDYYRDDVKSTLKLGDELGYFADTCSKTKIEEHLYITIHKQEIETGTSKEKRINAWKIQVTLTATKDNILDKFVKVVIEEYREHKRKANCNKLYHFIYQGVDSDHYSDSWDKPPKFSTQVLSDLVREPNTETFDHLTNEHSQQLMKDVKRLKDVEYYRQNGLKRKKGWLFYGHPGCGKTASVMAMANLDSRHIIEIPLSRVKTNRELEAILNISKINDIEFTRENIILLFDEIDCEMTQSRDSPKKEAVHETSAEGILKKLTIPDIKNRSDDLNLGTLLARLDGIGNYNGLIIIATTNHKEKLDPALYRDMRLTPLFFDYLRKEDSVALIEKFYNIKLFPEEIACIPDREVGLTPARLRVLLERYEDNSLTLLQHLNSLS